VLNAENSVLTASRSLIQEKFDIELRDGSCFLKAIIAAFLPLVPLTQGF
jgi:hypothetical protein